jgi:integrase
MKRADGRWEAKLDLGWVGGRRVRRSFYGRTRIEAVERLRRAQRAIDEGGTPPAEQMTVGEFLDHWLSEVVKPNRQHATWRGYEVNVRKHLKPVVGRARLARLSASDVQKLINALRTNGLAPRTVQYAHATLRAALGVALRWGLVSRNVATLVDPVSVPKHEVEPFGLDEARLVLDATSSDRLAAFFTVAMAVGLRPSEALGLRWSDIEFDGRRLRVRHVLERRRGGEVGLKPPKSRSSRRSIPLPAVCIEALSQHRRRQAEERLLAGEAWIGSDLGELVFTRATGQPLDRTFVSKLFGDLLARAGLGHRRLYDCRHTAASLLLAQGVAPRVVMEVLGHSSYALTMDTYTHVLPTVMRDAADAMDRSLGADRCSREEPAS